MITATTPKLTAYNVIPMKTKKQISMTGHSIGSKAFESPKSESFLFKMFQKIKDIFSPKTRTVKDVINSDIIGDTIERDANGRMSKRTFYRPGGTQCVANYKDGKYVDRTSYQPPPEKTNPE